MADENLSEEWRPIEGWPYEVSSLGRVRRATAGRNGAGYVAWPKGRLVKLKRQSSGHYSVGLHLNGRHRFFLVHRLVCAAFHGPAPSRKHEAAHFNGDAGDNVEGNLRWATHIENIADKIRHGRTNRGIQNLNAKLTDTAVRQIRTLLSTGTLKQVQIARAFNISTSHVTDIKTRKVWAWLDQVGP